MAIARFPVVAIDCQDPGELARFYGTILDWPVDVDDDGGWAWPDAIASPIPFA